MPSPRCRSGQAAVEYVAVLALLAVVLAGAGTAVAAPDLPREVVHRVRLALCIVGGDVCRAADAEAKRLEPCVTRDGVEEVSSTVTVGLLRLGGRGGWSVERRSDGTLLVTQREGAEAGPTAGAGAQLGPLFDVRAGATTTLGFARGRAWELPDEAALEQVIRAVAADPLHPERRLPEPAYRFVEGGGSAFAGAGGSAPKLTVVAGSLNVREAIGRRVGRGGTTWYYDAGGDVSTLLPGVGGAGRATFEYTEGSPPVLVMRAAYGGERQTVLVGRQVLDDPADAARVRRFLATAGPLKGVALFHARAVVARMREAGTLQRMTYEVRSSSEETGLGGGAGLQASLERAHTVVRRRLVDAVVLGRRPARRADCLGL